MRKCSDIKQEARGRLKGNYTFFFCAMMIFLLVQTLVYILPSLLFTAGTSAIFLISQYAVSFMLSVLVNILRAGLCKMSLDVSRQKQPAVSDLIFGYIHQADRFLTLELVITLIETLTSLPTILFSYFYLNGDCSLLFYVIFVPAWSLVAFLLNILLTLPLCMAVYCLIDDPHLSGMEAMRRSRRMTHGFRLRLFALQAGFIGYYILGVASLLIGFIWILPYRQVTLAECYDEIRHTENPDQAR